MDKYVKAVEAAVTGAIPELTRDLRAELLAAGWDAQTVRGIRVLYKDGKLTANVNEKVADAAFAHEYGAQTSPPKATLRAYGRDRDSDVAYILATSIAEKVGALL